MTQATLLRTVVDHPAPRTHEEREGESGPDSISGEGRVPLVWESDMLPR